MYIYNVTFLVADRKYGEWEEWLRKEHIPSMLNDTNFTEPQLVRVLNNESGEEKSFSLQFKIESISYLDRWMKSIEPQVIQQCMEKFGTEVLLFSTILEII